MTTRRARRSAIVLVALLALSSPALVACSLENIVEGAIDEASNGEGGVDLNLDGGLPDGFPEDAVPLIDGELIYGGGLTSEGKKAWNVTIQTTNADAMTAVTEQLTAAGFTKADDGPVDGVEGSAIGNFTSAEWAVTVITAPGEKDSFTVNYTVTGAA